MSIQKDSGLAASNAARVIYKLRRKTIRKHRPGERMNPNSIRFIIAIIISHVHAGQQSIAAEAFRKASGIYRSDRESEPAKLMNDKALAKILDDTVHVEYWHLEAIAESLKIPTGALLLVSRLYSIMGKNEPELSRSFIDGLKSFVLCLEKMAGSGDLTKDDLQDITKSFESAYDNERVQPDLF